MVTAVDCPPTVEIRAFHDPEARYILLILTNLTTSAFYPEIWPGVIRYVIPHHQITLRVRAAGPVTTVSSIVGAEVGFETIDDEVEVRIASLELYDGILIGYATSK